MAGDVSVLIADPQRLATLRDTLRLPGRVLRFSSNNLASAFESVRAHQAGMIALDALFAGTPEGQAFINRLGQLSVERSQIHLVAKFEGSWQLPPLAPAVAKSGSIDLKQ